MASVTIEVPDAIVPQVLAALSRRYPDLAALDDAALAREAVARMVRMELQLTEMDIVERDLQAQVEQARTDRQAEIAAAVAQIA